MNLCILFAAGDWCWHSVPWCVVASNVGPIHFARAEFCVLNFVCCVVEWWSGPMVSTSGTVLNFLGDNNHVHTRMR